MQIQDMRGWGPGRINRAFREMRRQMNTPVPIIRPSATHDPDMEREIAKDKQEMQAEWLGDEGHPEYEIEITEETVEEVINTHSDLK